MADIHKAPVLRHLRGAPTSYVRLVRGGRVVQEGVGLAFWFRPLSAIISEVPVDDRDVPFVASARTRDLQVVKAQGTITYRVVDPALALERIDFGIDPDTGSWRAAPLEQVAGLLVELVQQRVLEELTTLDLRDAITGGAQRLRTRIDDLLTDDPRLAGLGVELVHVSVGGVRAEPDLERSLETPTLEAIQQESDKATFERRAMAVERERAIAENELQNQIELAAREQSLIRERGANDRRRAEEAAAAALVETEAAAARATLDAAAQADAERQLASARAESTRLLGEAEGASELARVAAYREADPRTLVVLALRELASALPEIGQLTVTPDMLTAAVQRIAGGEAR